MDKIEKEQASFINTPTVYIKTLVKLAKKEEKKNSEFLYQLGLRFKNGDGVDANDKKAYKYFEKSAKLGHIQGQIETAVRWWKYWRSYYYAELYFQKAIKQGSDEAKKLLLEMQETFDVNENPVFLYRQGLKYLNGDGVEKDTIKAIDYLYKSGAKNYLQAKFEYAKYWGINLKFGTYYQKNFNNNTAQKWLKELCEKNFDGANDLLNGNDLSQISSKPRELYQTPSFKDDLYTAFCKRHTLISCPVCRAKLNLINTKNTGKTTDEYVRIYNKGTTFEHVSEAFPMPTLDGETTSNVFECENCKFSFTQEIHLRLEERDDAPNVKEILGSFIGQDTYRTKWSKIAEITYECNTPNPPKDALKILRKSEGYFDEDKI